MTLQEYFLTLTGTDKVLAAIQQARKEIVGKIEDFAAAVQPALSQIDAGLSNLAGDIANLQKQISDLQAAAGSLTPEQQAALDAISATATNLATKTKALSDVVPDVPPV